LVLVYESLELDWVALGGGKLFIAGERNVFKTMDLTKRVEEVIGVFSRFLDLEDLG